MMKMKIVFFFFIVISSRAALGQVADIEVDPRVRIYYSEAEVDSMRYNDPSALKKLNYYFQESFFIIPADTHHNFNKIHPLTIDVKRFESERHPTEQKSIVISANGDKLVLKSLKELLEEYKKMDLERSE